MYEKHKYEKTIEKNGNTYKSYLKYRYRAITETYLAFGAQTAK